MSLRRLAPGGSLKEVVGSLLFGLLGYISSRLASRRLLGGGCLGEISSRRLAKAVIGKAVFEGPSSLELQRQQQLLRLPTLRPATTTDDFYYYCYYYRYYYYYYGYYYYYYYHDYYHYYYYYFI